MKIFKSKKSAFVLKATAAALVLIMAGTSPAMALSEAYINSREIGNSTTYYNGYEKELSYSITSLNEWIIYENNLTPVSSSKIACEIVFLIIFLP